MSGESRRARVVAGHRAPGLRGGRTRSGSRDVDLGLAAADHRRGDGLVDLRLDRIEVRIVRPDLEDRTELAPDVAQCGASIIAIGDLFGALEGARDASDLLVGLLRARFQGPLQRLHVGVRGKLAAGGLLIRVGQDSMAGWQQVLRETSAYYLLGVQPEQTDRDGRLHTLRVKVDRRGATVRSRSWVVVPAEP